MFWSDSSCSFSMVPFPVSVRITSQAFFVLTRVCVVSQAHLPTLTAVLTQPIVLEIAQTSAFD